MSNRKNRARDWLLQSQNDLAYVKDSLKLGYFSQVCFMCQQVGEKAIKSIAYHRDFEVRGHSITIIARKLNINSEVEAAGNKLDQYYISARYPDAFAEGVPYQFYQKEQAEEAIRLAEIIVEKAMDEFSN